MHVLVSLSSCEFLSTPSLASLFCLLRECDSRECLGIRMARQSSVLLSCHDALHLSPHPICLSFCLWQPWCGRPFVCAVFFLFDWFDCHAGNFVRRPTRSSLIAGETWSWWDHDACFFVLISCLSSFFFVIRKRIGLGNHGIVVTLSSRQELALFLDGCETAYGGVEG